MKHKSNSKRPFPVIMNADMIKQLKLEAARNDRSAAALIRELVAIYLKEKATILHEDA